MKKLIAYEKKQKETLKEIYESKKAKLKIKQSIINCFQLFKSISDVTFVNG